MKSPISLVVLVCLLIVLAIAVCCLLSAVGVLNATNVLEYVNIWAGIHPDTGEVSLMGRIDLAAGGIALAALSLIGLYTYLRGPRRKGQISFAGAEGEVTVATAGLEEFIRRAAEGIPGVREGQALVKQRGNNLAVVTSVVLNSPRPVMEITREIQNRIRHEIEHRLGLPKGTEIQVHVRRMIPAEDEGPGSMMRDSAAESAGEE